MNPLFLSDTASRENLFPFTLTRSTADIRVGILTIREKWNRYLGLEIPLVDETSLVVANANILSSAIIPSPDFVHSLINEGEVSGVPKWESVKILQYPWHIFQWNDWALRQDYALITRDRVSEAIPASVQAIHSANIFIEKGAKLSHCILNAETGPIYIGRNTEIMEGALIRGPFALCEGAVVKMGSRIYGATTIGPGCVVGGEIKNTVMFGYSNKAHDGYLGDSVIGEWCNLGAGCSNSNVKNNVSEVRMYHMHQQEYVNTGLFKCGLIMGDYSRASINTSFNTGTLVGVCANIFGEKSTPKYIPSFSWGNDGTVRYDFEKAIADIEKWKKLKGSELTIQEKKRLNLIFEQNN